MLIFAVNLVMLDVIFSFNKSKLRVAPYAVMNCSSFVFYGWLTPYRITEDSFYPAEDLHLILQYGVGDDKISLSYFYDCVDNYYRCAINYIRDMFIPYLYRCHYFYYDKLDDTLTIKYPEILQGVSQITCTIHDDVTRRGVYAIFSPVNNTHYYLDEEPIYFNLLPRSVFLIDPQTELTNTQYTLSDEPNLVLYTSFKTLRFNHRTYDEYYLVRSLGKTSSASTIRNSVIGTKIYDRNEEGVAEGLRGKVNLKFYFPFENLSNRFSGLEYGFEVKWSDNVFSGVEGSKLTTRVSFIRGPNTVIYLRGIEVRK